MCVCVCVWRCKRECAEGVLYFLEREALMRRAVRLLRQSGHGRLMLEQIRNHLTRCMSEVQCSRVCVLCELWASQRTYCVFECDCMYVCVYVCVYVRVRLMHKMLNECCGTWKDVHRFFRQYHASSQSIGFSSNCFSMKSHNSAANLFFLIMCSVCVYVCKSPQLVQ